MIKRSDHKCSTPLIGNLQRCGLGNQVCLRVLFLQEQVRDLRVQKLLRELVVGIAAPSDITRSLQQKSFIVLKAGTQSKCSQTLKQISRVCDFLSLSYFCFISCILLLFISITCLIFPCASQIYLLGIVCSHQYLTKRAIVAPQLLVQRNLEEIVQSYLPGIRLHTLVIRCVQLQFAYLVLIPHLFCI